jgi:hypothetical protein
LLGLIMAFGAGVLISAANTMMPEALHYGGKLAGFVTTLGFALAFAISSLRSSGVDRPAGSRRCTPGNDVQLLLDAVQMRAAA